MTACKWLLDRDLGNTPTSVASRQEGRPFDVRTVQSTCIYTYVGPGLDNGPVVDVSVLTNFPFPIFKWTACIYVLHCCMYGVRYRSTVCTCHASQTSDDTAIDSVPSIMRRLLPFAKREVGRGLGGSARLGQTRVGRYPAMVDWKTGQ